MKSLSIFRVATIIALAMSGVSHSAVAADDAKSSGKTLVYFGTYTGPKSKGIYVSTLDSAGKLSTPELAGEANRPSWVGLHPNGKFLYAVDETDKVDGKSGGAVTAFAIDPPTGKLKRLNQQTSGGPGPCHLSVDATGKAVLVANYNGGSIESLPVDAEGKLGAPSAFIQHHGSSVDPQRQKEPHAHGIYLDAVNKHAYVPDLGMDKIMIYSFNEKTGKLREGDAFFITVPPGSGPRHFAFHPKRPFAYAINEISCTVAAFTYKSEYGDLGDLQVISTLPPGESVQPGFSTAEIEVHPSGRFLYGSNRGHNTIVVYSVNAGTGRLTHLENVSTQGKTPRGFGIDPTGNFLIAGNQDSHNVCVFRIDQDSGRLTPTGQTVEVGSPVCVKFLAR